MNSQQPITENWMSMYVPCIPPDMMLDGKRFSTIEDVTDFFENKLCIGKVKRVDLITKPRGHTNILAAFVHFDCWYHTSEDMRKFMMGDGNGQCNIHGYFKRTNEDDRGEHRNFYSSQNRSFGRYLTCKINTNPIPEIAPMLASELNIHQLVHALEVARETISENEKRLEEQARRIAELEQLLGPIVSDNKGPIVADVMTPIVADVMTPIVADVMTPMTIDEVDVSGNEYMGHNKSSYV
jgi:hypothetical protein